jgi:hypothetical protein
MLTLVQTYLIASCFASGPLFSFMNNVDQILIDLDRLNAPIINSKTVPLGPFSVFQSQTYSPEEASVEPCGGESTSLPEY